MARPPLDAWMISKRNMPKIKGVPMVRKMGGPRVEMDVDVVSGGVVESVAAEIKKDTKVKAVVIMVVNPMVATKRVSKFNS